MKIPSYVAIVRSALLAILMSLTTALSPAAVGAAELDLYVQNAPHLAHARALLLAALEAGGLEANFHEAPDGNEPRGLHMITSGQVQVDMVPATPQRLQLLKEGKLRMIPIPLDRGLLGYRVGLVVESRRELLAGVRSGQDLQRFTVGQGEGWKDLEIYRHANIPTREIKYWENGDFARQMQAGTLDFFPLGLEEAFSYFLPHYQKQFPQMTVEPHLIIRYPWFRFVWVSPSPEHDELYAALLQGFKQLVDRGEFVTIWQQHRQLPADELFENRNIIDLANPYYNLELIPPEWLHLLVIPVQKRDE